MKDKLDFDTLFKMHYNDILRLAFFITTDRILAEDVAQEALLIVYDKLHTLKDKSKFKYWLNKIVINCANQVLKKNSKYIYTENIEFINDVLNVDIDKNDPLYIMEEKELNRFIYSAIASLGDLERKIFVLRYFEKYSFKEIADTLEINASTARTIVFRGKKLLENKLEQYYNPDPKEMGNQM